MAQTSFPTPPAGVAVVAAAAWTLADRVGVASAFQTPIIFPLLWLARRLAHRPQRIGSPGPELLSMSPLTGMKEGIDPIKVKGEKKRNGARAEKILAEWLQGLAGASSLVNIDENGQGLRGLFAARDIQSGELLVQIPYGAALLVGDSLRGTVFDDFNDVPGSNCWSNDDVDDAYQGLYLLQNFVESRDYAHYISNLPRQPASGNDEGLTPDFWPDETIRGLQVPSVVDRILHRKQIVRVIAEKNNVDENELRWATWMVRSRRFTTWNMVNDPNCDEENESSLFGVFPSRKGAIEQVQGFLLPIIDMANHAHDPNAALKISVNRFTREFDNTSSFALTALKRIRKGEEVTISYGDGDRTSLDLLEKYGFFLEGNDADETIDWEELKPHFTTSLEEDEAELASMLNDDIGGGSRDLYRNKGEYALSATKRKLKKIVANIQSYSPIFQPELDGGGLCLVGSGVREKVGIKLYAVAMYTMPSTLEAAAPFTSSTELRDAMYTFNATSSTRTAFVLKMILRADARTIAAAISNSVRLRYNGPPTGVECLEAVISKGLIEGGGQAPKGTTLRFDCTENGVRLAVDDVPCGVAESEGLGGAFVDVFTDKNAVSPSLVEDCLRRQNGYRDGHLSKRVQKYDGSRRTMLSLRVLMKRLANLELEGIDLENANGTMEEDLSNKFDNEEIQTEMPMSSPTSEIDVAATVEGNDIDGKLVPQDDESPHVISEIHTTASTDEVDAASFIQTTRELGQGASKDIKSAGENGLPTVNPVDVLESATNADQESKATEDSIVFNAEAVEVRIRQLEAEIEAEIARLKSINEKPAEVQSTENTNNPPLAAPKDEAEKEQDLQVKEEIQEAIEEQGQDERDVPTILAAEDAEARQRYEAIERKMKPITDRATGAEFAPKLDEGMYLVGVGVRKKAIINVYSVAMYSSSLVLEALSSFQRGKQKKDAQAALRNTARTFDASSPMTTFLLKMTFKVDAQTIAGAIADGVKPRYGGPPGNTKQLESLIIEGLRDEGGQATKGTIFRFDCSKEGVEVIVNGLKIGTAAFDGMGSAFVDVFMDNKSVSPQLITSCLDAWCGSSL